MTNQESQDQSENKAQTLSSLIGIERSKKSISATQQFADFFKDQISIIGTLISSLPILTSYLEIIFIPEGYKYVTLSAAIICASLFFSVFWYRDELIRRMRGKTLLLGIFLVASGIIILISYVEYSPYLPVGTGRFIGHIDKNHLWLILGYILGFTSLTTGISFISIYGFVRETERHYSLLSYLAKITPEQWDFVQDLIYSLSELNERSEDLKSSSPAKEALINSARYFYANTRKMFKRLDTGEITVLGPGPNKSIIFSFFLEKAIRLRALSYNDVSLWANKKESEDHLKSFEGIQEKERIFILSKDLFRDKYDLFYKTFTNQIAKNIKIRIAISELLPPEISSSNKLDFGILDSKKKGVNGKKKDNSPFLLFSRREGVQEGSSRKDSKMHTYYPFAVFFWRGERFPGYREFAISIDSETCKANQEIYEKVIFYCVKHTTHVKDEDVEEATQIKDIDQLERVVENIKKSIELYERK